LFRDRRNLTTGATIRVDAIFNASPEVGLWDDRPASLQSCLMFVTISSNVRTRRGTRPTMGSQSNKHIGIFAGNKIWNYANLQDRVVAETVSAFQARYRASYHTSGTTVVFYYGRFLT
jgi:hypothetical protein